jgi:plastocyanin
MPAVRRTSLALAFVGALASFLTLVAPAPTRAAEHVVQIADSAFSPATLTISVGDTVTWRNADDRPHTVTSNDGAFDSGNLDEGQGFSFTFTEPGTYTYLCEYHPDMQATIVVEAASVPAPAAGGTTSGGTGGGGPTSAGTDAGGNGTATGDGTAPAGTSHDPRTHDFGQPDTALEAPTSLAWLAPLLIGLGLVAFAFGLLPPAREPARAEPPTAGSRR